MLKYINNRYFSAGFIVKYAKEGCGGANNNLISKEA
jgi:hypothetical protein